MSGIWGEYILGSCGQLLIGKFVSISVSILFLSIFCLVIFHSFFFINYYLTKVPCHSLVNSSTRICRIVNRVLTGLSLYVCRGLRIICARNWKEPWFFRKHWRSLMKKDGVRYRHFIDHRHGFMLDLYVERYAEVRLWCEEKIVNGDLLPCLFVCSLSRVSRILEVQLQGLWAILCGGGKMCWCPW